MTTKFSGQQTFDVVKYERECGLREVGDQAVWSLSSCKPGKVIDSNHFYFIYWFTQSVSDWLSQSLTELLSDQDHALTNSNKK